MALFEYKALGAGGAATAGRIEAGGRQEAARLLEQRGLTPVRVAEMEEKGKRGGSAKAGGGDFSFKSKKINFAALEDFTRSLASLLAASVPLSRALTILYRENANPAAAAKWRELHDWVVEGVSLSDAMARSPEVFPRVYVAMVESGEAGGFLEVVLAQIADFQAREKEIRGKVMSAMMYPAVLLTLALGVMIFLMVFFIPRFQTLFAGFDASLPLITQIIVNTSHFLRTYGIYAAGAVGAAISFGRGCFVKESNRRLFEKYLLKIPIIGPLASQIALARFCRM